jgi:diadenosine tetraphosphate (Ap4A) HIT family hydrolase
MKEKEWTNPVYQNKYVKIFHDRKNRVPGLYEVELSSGKEVFYELTETELCSLTFTLQLIRISLDSKLGIELGGVYIEERPNKPLIGYIIPFHVDKLKSQYSIKEYQPHIEAYLKSYKKKSHISEIKKYDKIILSSIEGASNNTVGTKKICSEYKNPRLAKKEEGARVRLPQIEEVLEVYDESEFPKEPEGKKYYVVIGGNKNFQGFLTENSLSKGEFLNGYNSKLDACIRPIYEDAWVIVRQDAKYAVPGFYIVSPKAHYRDIKKMPFDLYRYSLRIATKVRKGLSELGVKRAHIYHDEKYRAPASAHFWVLPLDKTYLLEEGLNPTIHSFGIWEYLENYPKYSKKRNAILRYNKKMATYMGR